ncbi:IPT/TIG domain protein [Luteitalea pratensis]|uniref:IPT/TIG domain protein n=1 Tax=Luteitalea pratensis TaxID=1855912 RepID=A0A143PPL3_LUTPR|nr:IPT/TIG domain-containing protein [Luteitalea pratensis]AMY09764.1 IPT/TIG domain protein [Luteitalea pratensis]
MICPGLPGQFRRAWLTLCLLLLVQAGPALAGSVRLYWDPNTEPDLAGYVLVYGNASGVYTTSVTLPASAVTHEFIDLPDGTYYFAVRAFNAANAQSGYSNEVRVVISTPDEDSSPTITSLTPSSGPTTGGTTITISGSDFRAGATVFVGGTPATVTAATDTWATVVAPASSAGLVAVTLTNPDGGTYTFPSSFTYVTAGAPVSDPVITSVTPASGPTTGGSAVTLSGVGFQAGATVLFGGSPGTVTSVTTTSIKVTNPVGPAGPVTITVVNPDGGSMTMAAAFTYVQPAVTAPTISTISPASGPTTGNTLVTMTGTGFKAGVIVKFGDVAGSVTSVATTTLSVLTPAAVAGPVAVTVTNTDGGAASRGAGFTYVATSTAGSPTVTSFSPSFGSIAGGTNVTITGTNFKSGVVVRLGALSGTVMSVTATSIVVRTPAQTEGIVSLTVLNSDGNGVLLPQAFTYRAPAPVVTSLSPVKGPAMGNTDVTINGSNFRAGVSVSVDTLQATIVSVTATRIVARMPAHAPTLVGLTVTNPDSQLVWKPSAYTYVSGGPAITQVLPGSGPMSGANTIAILGSGFSNATVAIGGVNATVLTRTADMLTVRVPAHGAGVVALLVRNSDGLSVTAPNAYAYEDPNAPFTRLFAEGASGSFFQTRFALANPHDEAVPVTVTFTDTAGTPTTMEMTIAAGSRATIDESNRPPLASEAFATKFEAPRVLGIERTMTWAAGGPIYGAHSDTGVAAPRTSWLLAEGATIGGFNTFYLLQNPTTTAAEVKVQYLLSTGQRIERIHPVAPLSRTNIWVNKDAPELAAAEMSATITSLNNVPVVVERSMYRNNGNELFSAGHNSAAVDVPALRWFLAEGATGGTFDEFVLIANPNGAPANLKVSYLRAGKSPLVKNYTAAPQSRLTIWVDKEAPELASAEVSIIVESLTATPVVVERSMWWRATPAGEWIEAHNNRAVTTTTSRWLVADGESGGPGDATTYVLVANTAAAAAQVRFTLLTESGVARTVQDTVTANGRYSMDVAGTFPEARGKRFSVLVEGVSSSAALVVERASYSSTPTTTWAAGTNSLAMPLP